MKFIFALFALICMVAFATALQAELFSAGELAALERGLARNEFTKAQRDLIYEALEEQIATIEALEAASNSKSNESWISRAIIHNKYVHWAAIGVGAVIVLAAAVFAVVFAVRRYKASKSKETTDERSQGLLSENVV